jgi:hypothetical protein
MGDTEELLAAIGAMFAYYVTKHNCFRLMYYQHNNEGVRLEIYLPTDKSTGSRSYQRLK